MPSHMFISAREVSLLFSLVAETHYSSFAYKQFTESLSLELRIQVPQLHDARVLSSPYEDLDPAENFRTNTKGV
ncbi:hypothetical protein VNO77_18189 [Canavalia gladiata]|uniref:Uncharacterized protein n=1 Tax=Canavalia gladiata TaxID=3824 RepID=A0AAN9LKH0_CANGL